MPELANFAAGSLLFGQFLSDRPYSIRIGLVGVLGYAVLMGPALVLRRRG